MSWMASCRWGCPATDSRALYLTQSASCQLCFFCARFVANSLAMPMPPSCSMASSTASRREGISQSIQRKAHSSSEAASTSPTARQMSARSEERRVGKECGYGGEQCRHKAKDGLEGDGEDAD